MVFACGNIKHASSQWTTEYCTTFLMK